MQVDTDRGVLAAGTGDRHGTAAGADDARTRYVHPVVAVTAAVAAAAGAGDADGAAGGDGAGQLQRHAPVATEAAGIGRANAGEADVAADQAGVVDQAHADTVMVHGLRWGSGDAMAAHINAVMPLYHSHNIMAALEAIDSYSAGNQTTVLGC